MWILIIFLILAYLDCRNMKMRWFNIARCFLFLLNKLWLFEVSKEEDYSICSILYLFQYQWVNFYYFSNFFRSMFWPMNNHNVCRKVWILEGAYIKIRRFWFFNTFSGFIIKMYGFVLFPYFNLLKRSKYQSV